MSPGTHHRIAVVAETSADARDVLVEGESGILAVHPADFRPLYEPSKRRLTWPNGAVATLYNAVEPDQLRGPQHDAALCDELAKWRYARETWDQLQFGMRLGLNPKRVITTTPRPIPLIREIMADAHTITTRGSTMDNAANLAPSFMQQIVARYEGTRLGRQELNAEMFDDVPGALWTRAMIDGEADAPKRVKEAPRMRRVVIAVDPSGTSGAGEDQGDDIGIVAAGLGEDGRGYVLGDWSVNLSPAGWARRAVEAFDHFKADRIVAERNFGGAMVESTIRTARKSAPVKLVTASRGKVARAEPIAALYEQGKISHVGSFAALEDQLCSMTPEGYVGEGSPDRADALVWALTELMLGGSSYNILNA
jgi:phage terminase large subunit-like protein